jgi:hypothetical protein
MFYVVKLLFIWDFGLRRTQRDKSQLLLGYHGSSVRKGERESERERESLFMAAGLFTPVAGVQ